MLDQKKQQQKNPRFPLSAAWTAQVNERAIFTVDQNPYFVTSDLSFVSIWHKIKKKR